MGSILIVDDEPRMRELVRRWLTPLGYAVTEAANAETALAMSYESAPSVVLLDVHMPGRDGLWLLDELREQFPAVAVVLATASDNVPPGVSLKNGVVDYLVKPFEASRVIDAVGRAASWAADRARDTDAGCDPKILDVWLREGRR